MNKRNAGFSAAILMVCLASILLNVFLYSQLRKYYTLLFAVELDPLGLSAFQDELPPKPANDELTVVFFGDSRAAQWPNPEIEGFTFLNRGIGNQTTTQVLHRFNAHIAPLHPDVIVLQVGVNDLKTLPLFPGAEANILADCKANIQAIVDRSLRLGSVVVLSTVFPTGKVPLQRRLVWSDDINQAIVEVNAYIESMAKKNVFILPAADMLSGTNEEMKPEYSGDELHLNPAGYAALNAELTELLDRIQNERK